MFQNHLHFYLGKLRTEINELEKTNDSIISEKQDALKALESIQQEKERLQEQIDEFQSRVKELQEERDEEKKNRVNFEMRLVEFEDYRKHAETDIVSFVFPGQLRVFFFILLSNFSQVQ